MTPSYVTASRITELRQQLSHRDNELIRTLATIRLATGAQLCRLHFHDVPSAERQCRRTLTRLVRLGVLVRLDREVGRRGGGSQSHPFALDVSGQRLGYVEGTAYGQRPRPPWLPSTPFIRHVMAVSELYVRLIEAQRSGGREVIQYRTEPLCWRYFRTMAGGRGIAKPDAFLRLACGQDYEDAWFIEVDLDTEHRPALERKFASYHQHWLSGDEQGKHGSYPQVLWLVPDEHRRQIIREIAAQQPSSMQRVHLVHLYDDAAAVMEEVHTDTT
jgi:hypothetical protein